MKISKVININKLVKLAHENAKNKGFHDKPMSNLRKIILIITEICEGYEHFRCNDRAKIKEFTKWYESNPSYFNQFFESTIKNTLEEELADVFIRLLDFIGSLGWEINDIEFPLNGVKAENEEYFDKKIFQMILDITSIVIKHPKNMNFNDSLKPTKLVKGTFTEMFLSLIKLARYFKFDLIQVVEWKMKYNESRPHLHGKEF